MPVVSNTSPILNLAIINRLYLLQKQFGEIMIPSAVLAELRTGEELPGSHIIREAIDSGWIKVEHALDIPLINVLQRDLDKGESEAIALAVQTKAQTVLIDEREARRSAKSLGLKVTGVLGIILHAKSDGDLLSVSETIQDLSEKAGFRIAPNLLAGITK